MRGCLCKLLRSQVAENDDKRVLHLLDWDELPKARADLTDLSIANIDLLEVELVAALVVPNLNNAANTNIELGNIRDICRGSATFGLGWLLLLFLLLLLLLLLGLGLTLLLLFFARSGRLGSLRLLLLTALSGLITAFGSLLATWGTALFLLLGFGHLLKLALRRPGALSVKVWECGEKTLALHLLEQAWQVLNVVNPSEGVRKGKLLESLQLTAEERSQGRENDQVGCSDALTDQEHANFHVLVDLLSKLASSEPADSLDVLANLVASN